MLLIPIYVWSSARLCRKSPESFGFEASDTFDLLLDLGESVLEDGFSASAVLKVVSYRLLRALSLQDRFRRLLSNSALRPRLSYRYLESDHSSTLHSTVIMIHRSLVAPL